MQKLKEIAIALLAKLVTADVVATAFGKVAAALMERARKTGKWESFKKTNRYIRDVATVLDRVYEDDTLTADEEAELGRVLADGLDPKIALGWFADRDKADSDGKTDGAND